MYATTRLHLSNIIYITAALFLLWSHQALAAGKILSLTNNDGKPTIAVSEGDPIELQVRIDDAEGIAATAFTILYDAENLALRDNDPVTSDFFTSFVQQGLLEPPDEPDFVEVAGQQYTSPISAALLYPQYGPTPLGTQIAAARDSNGSGTDVTLFTLHFELIGDPGEYPVIIAPTLSRNPRAGYPRSGEELPVLMGYENDSYQTHTASLNQATIIVRPPFVDTDGDGIDDNWERFHAPADFVGDPLSLFSRYGDYDKDGYTDYQEYINDLNLEVDPGGDRYSPTARNSAGGTGHEPIGKKVIPAINLLLMGD